jgi:hypothetical protein
MKKYAIILMSLMMSGGLVAMQGVDQEWVTEDQMFANLDKRMSIIIQVQQDAAQEARRLQQLTNSDKDKAFYSDYIAGMDWQIGQATAIRNKCAGNKLLSDKNKVEIKRMLEQIVALEKHQESKYRAFNAEKVK